MEVVSRITTVWRTGILVVMMMGVVSGTGTEAVTFWGCGDVLGRDVSCRDVS